MSRKYEVENETSQGSVISPILFSIMINVSPDMGMWLFVDDGALSKKEENWNV